jgi:hypothetical protein
VWGRTCRQKLDRQVKMKKPEQMLRLSLRQNISTLLS